MKNKYRVTTGIYEDHDFWGYEQEGRIIDCETGGRSYPEENCIQLMFDKDYIQKVATDYAINEMRDYEISHPFPEGYPQDAKDNLKLIFIAQAKKNFIAGIDHVKYMQDSRDEKAFNDLAKRIKDLP